MVSVFPSARHQAALSTPTGYRRWSRYVFFRGGTSLELEPVSGSFTQDARRAGRWNGKLSFVGDNIIPNGPQDILTPFGTRVSVELGLELLDGSISYIPYGVYEISSSSVKTSAGSRSVSVSLADISGRVDRYRFESPYTVASGSDLSDVVNNVISNRTGVYPGVVSTGVTTGAARVFGLETGTGPWKELIDVLDSFSRTVWYNRSGSIAIGTVNPDTDLAYPAGPMIDLSVDFDDRPPNVIVARGEGQGDDVPVQAVVVDDEPSSPTYAGPAGSPGSSPYGRVTYYYSSPLIKTSSQAASAARTILDRYRGQGATYAMTCPYDPTIDADDVINFNGTNFVVDAVTVDITGSTGLQVRKL